MPGKILSADTGFPDLQKQGSTEEKLKTISSYLFMLLESLRYTLSNLGAENFNDHELKLMSQKITEPVTLRIENAEGDIAELYLAADEISSEVQAVDGRVTQVKETADGLVITVAGNTGDIARISNTISGLNIQTAGQTGDGQTHISGVAVEIRDTNGNVLGYFRRDTNGSGEEGQTPTRMFLGATGNYALKLESKVNTSYESKEGNVYIKAGKGKVYLEGKDCVQIQAPSGPWYRFLDDGIYYGNTKIVDNSTPAGGGG